ncbi:MAG: penicillin-binding transpeptidase domain-containing protein, partial [Rhodocyclaceae bacterium]
GGYRIQPYVVRDIRDDKDQILAQAQPTPAGIEELRIIDPRNAFVMDSLLRDVTIYGTAARASATLKRKDLAGKTGTTNEHVDAWFCGYQQTLTGCAWMGFDQPKDLGKGETGGAAALPIWINYMAKALKDVPESFPSVPEGMVSKEVVGAKGPAKEYFYKEHAPEEVPEQQAGDADSKPVD